MEKEELTPEEKRAFESLSRKLNPTDSMEKDTVKRLKTEGLIQSTRVNKLNWMLYPAAASLVFILGFLSGNIENGINKKEAYMLILFEDKNFNVASTAEAAIEYGLWNAEVNEAGTSMDGQELWNEAYQISLDGVEKIDATHEQRITGYFMLEASSSEEAIAIARDSPHIKYGGTIQLKQFRVR